MTLTTTLSAAALAISLFAWHTPSEAAVYKCEVNGKTAYQAEPCAGGREVPLQTRAPTPPQTSGSSIAPSTKGLKSNDYPAKKDCSGDSLSLDFRNVALPTVLEVIANFSGRHAQTDPSVTGSAPVQYACTPWRVVLQDLAQRHQLDIRVEEKWIYVRKR